MTVITITPWFNLTTQPILVIAPHRDDEVIGGGGLLLLHSLRGGESTVLYLTCSDEQRRCEGYFARTELGIKYSEELGLIEGQVQSTIQTSKEIAKLVEQVQPQTILAPSINDIHPDHRNAHFLLSDALSLVNNVVGEILLYEGFTPIADANVWVDISAVATRKWKALASYASQNQRYHLVKLVQHLNAFRALTTMRPAVSYAEVFKRLSVEEYLREVRSLRLVVVSRSK